MRDTSSLARLGAIFEDAAGTATDQWLRHTLVAHGLQTALDDPEWPSLVSRARETALAGHDLAALIEEAVAMRPTGDAHSTAAVLHWRLGALGATPAPRPRGQLASLPPTDAPAVEVARQAGELMRQRWRDMRAALAATLDPLPWAQPLGARPEDADAQAAWLNAAAAVTAYRERYQIPDHTQMLGPRPGASRPDARAAWDHACLQADRYLARRLRDLNDHQLAELGACQQTILDNPPPFDPGELERARQRLNAARATGDPRPRGLSPEQLLVQRLERAAQAHRDWRRAATDAHAIRRQIALEHHRQQRESRIRRMAVRLGR